MKQSFMAIVFMSVALVVAGPVAANAEDMSSSQLKALKSAGIQVYPGASFTTGDDSDVLALWFRSKDSPDKIMDWYKQKLSGWSKIVINGTRVIYKGPPGIDSKYLSSLPYVFTRTTDESGVSKNSEITIRIPK